MHKNPRTAQHYSWLFSFEYYNDNNDEVNKIIKFIQERLPIKEDKGLKRYFVKKNETWKIRV